MKFAVDIMLGKLAKLLRIIGYDTQYDTAWTDDDLVDKANNEGRFILTRDRLLAARLPADSSLFIESQVPREQFRQVVECLKLDTATRFFTVCTLCNTQVSTVSKAQVAKQVPPYICKSHDAFLQCSTCGRVYWQGSHFNNAKRWIREALARNNGD